MQLDISKILLQPATVYYLRMDANPHYHLQQPANTAIKEIGKPVSVEEYRKYYSNAGKDYHWLDRLVMPAEELHALINAPNNFLFVLFCNNEETGYVELLKENQFVELQYFGLFPLGIGKGLGKYFLQWAIKKAWSFNPEWLQVNTCSLDHPAALPLYKKCGFVQYNQTIEQRKVYSTPV